MNRLLALLLLSSLIACQSEDKAITDMRTEEEKQQAQEEVVFEVESSAPEEPIETTVVKNSPFSYRLIEGDNGWGYQIYEDSSLRINQTHIPSIPGVRGFDTKARAEIAARYIVGEMNKGIFPPTVNAEILEKIGAID
jgi:hypothetical protein